MDSLRSRFDARTQELRDEGDLRSAVIMELVHDAVRDFVSDKLASGVERRRLEDLRKRVKSLDAASRFDAVLAADPRYGLSSSEDEDVDWVYELARGFWEREFSRMNAC